MRNFQGFAQGEQTVVEARSADAEALCMLCANKLTLSTSPKPEIGALLSEAFNITKRDEAREVMDTFMMAKMRLGQVTYKRDTTPKAPNAWEAAAYVIASSTVDANSIFIRNEFFGELKLDQTTKLIHECVHLRYPNNPGDGHPGGKFMMFNGQRLKKKLPFTTQQAIRNPYCYEYFAQVVSTL